MGKCGTYIKIDSREIRLNKNLAAMTCKKIQKGKTAAVFIA